MIDINGTLLIQLVNFIVALVGMNFLLIKPIRAIVRKRRDLASALLRDAEQFTAEAARKLEHYEAALARTREEAARNREADKAAALAREDRILADAQKEAQDFLRAARESTGRSVSQAMEEMRGRIPGLAKLAADVLLGKKSTGKSGR
jgi:F-type H+-transporting ATPase subunit b